MDDGTHQLAIYDEHSKKLEERMKLGILGGGSGARVNINLDAIKRAEAMGFDSVWTAEAYGGDAV